MIPGRRWVTLPGSRKFECFVRGPGPELLVVHPGGPGLTGEYLSGLLALGRKPFQVVLFHPRGVGRSWAPRRAGGYTLGSHVRDLEALRRAWRAERFHLLGFSAGGFVALEYARSHPDRLSSLLLCGTAGSASEIRQANRQMRADAPVALRRRLVALERRRAFRTVEYAELAERIAQPFQTRFLSPPLPMIGQLSPAVYKAMMTRTGDEFRVDGTLARWDGRGAYRALRVPTLVAVGRYDFFYRAALRAAREIPGATLVVLPRSSHLSVLEEPIRFRTAVGRFLARVVAGRNADSATIGRAPPGPGVRAHGPRAT